MTKSVRVIWTCTKVTECTNKKSKFAWFCGMWKGGEGDQEGHREMLLREISWQMI